MSTTYDAVIVGGGVTGLVAAWRLTEAGRSVLVLEARDRVGGRLRSEVHDGSLFEIGGQWVSPDQDALKALLDELGLETFARYRQGASVYVDRAGQARQFTGEDLPVGPETVAAIEQLTKTLDDLTAEIDPDRPWAHPEAERLDRITFQHWLEEQCDDVEARDNIALYIGPAMLTKPVWAFSALQALLMAASAGSFRHLVDADFILDRRVAGGLASVPLELARRLGDRVRLSQDVTAVEYDVQQGEGATVVVGTERIRARRVIVAVPPPLVRRIRFSPELPAEHRQAREHQSFGLVVKVQVEYPTPFWREQGLSGTGFGPYQPVHEVYDNTPEGSATGKPTGHLVGFVSDEEADRIGRLSADDRRAEVLESLVAYFGEQARTPTTYVESDWQHQELTGGAYGTSYDVGGLTRYRQVLREPVGPIEFGTSDVSGLGFQHVDGAVRVGTDLAERALSER